MITTDEFKRQIGKPFGVEMRKLGFKGNGFNYAIENEDFLSSVCISPGRWGGNCSVILGIHPKCITKVGNLNLNLKKLPIHLHEFRMSLSKTVPARRWGYCDTEVKNILIMHKIIALIKSRAIPVIRLYTESPTILETFKVTDLRNFHKKYAEKTGTYIATSGERFAWALAMFFEFTNPVKAKRFSEYGLSRPGDTFFGNQDFERILSA